MSAAGAGSRGSENQGSGAQGAGSNGSGTNESGGGLASRAANAARSVPEVADLRRTARTSLQGLTRRSAHGAGDHVDVRPDGAGWAVRLEVVASGSASVIEAARAAQEAVHSEVAGGASAAVQVDVTVAGRTVAKDS